jgi:membrane-associated phospholipid phosphatase
VDSAAYRWVNRLAGSTPWAHAPLAAYAKFGIVIFALLLLIGWLIARRWADAGKGVAGVVWGGLAALVALGLNQVIGHIVARPRPFVAMPSAHVLIPKTHDFSFPSDHTTVAAAVVVALWLVDRRLGLVAAGFALIMAFARVYVGVHYPGDVLGGFVVGGLVASAGLILVPRVLVPLAERVSRSPLRALVTTQHR